MKNDKKVVSINKWKQESFEKGLTGSFDFYFKTLNFHDLINEAQIILGRLRDFPLDKEVALESKSLINEINTRIKYNPTAQDSNYIEIEEAVEQRLKEFHLER